MAYLVFEDGRSFKGEFFACDKSIAGDLVYVTDMVGFEDVVFNPNFEGKIVVFTYPMIGNYGIDKKTIKGKAPLIKGVVAKEFCKKPSNFAMDMTIKEFFEEYGITALAGVDTRAIVKHIINAKKTNSVIVGEYLKEKAVPFERALNSHEGEQEVKRILALTKERR